VRARFVRSTLVVVLTSIGVLSVLLLWINQQAIERDYQQRLRTEAQRLATSFSEMSDPQRVSESLRSAQRAGREVRVRTPSGDTLDDGGVAGDPAWTRTVSQDGWVVTVVESSDDARRAEVWSAILILALGASAALIAIVVTWRESRRAVAPLASLAEAAARLGAGDARSTGVRYGVAELDAVAEALDSSAARINQLVSQERDLTVDVSHQLRTPLTALSMRLDEILVADDLGVVRGEAVAAQEQVERLAGVVESLLRDRDPDAPEPSDSVPLDAVVDQQVREWGPAYEAARRGLVVTGERGMTARGTRGGVAQVLATLLENSLLHGEGATTITTRRVGGALVLEVRDQGSGVPAELAGQVFERSVSGGGGTGVGLALARSTAHEFGGQLQLLDAASAKFGLFLTEA